VYRELAVTVAVAFLTTALVIVIALLAAVGAGKLARLDGASYPTALTRAATTFAAVITLAAAVAGALAALFT
jgi:predicted membrane-bound mannosyltransferase